LTSLLIDIGNSRGTSDSSWCQAEGSDATIVLTGGDASRILKSLGEESSHRPHLVLQGLAQLLENRK